MTSGPEQRALVYGLAVTGAATVRALRNHGIDAIVVDDHSTPERRALADDLDVELVGAPDDDALERLVEACQLVVPAPGVPETHRVITSAIARGRRLVTELELAYEWEQQRPGGPRPMLAVTGTDGKTTTTLMAVAMLEAAGCASVAAGNTDIPLVSALDLEVDAFVVECTSFRLAFTEHFRGDAAAWLNLAPDHLNWHRSMESYVAAKDKIFAHQRRSDVAIGYRDDPVVMAHLERAPARHVTFGGSHGGSGGGGADYHVAGMGNARRLVGPGGVVAEAADMVRSLPHDLTNALAAAALVIETGLADASAVSRALGTFTGPPHRIEHVGSAGGVEWYNDSKATTPHAAAVAIEAFERVVLIAGGRNKGLDMAPMASSPRRIRAVVAIGEAAEEVAATFADPLAGTDAPILRASSMADAVDVAGATARSGDVVLLSPGCASFDWYPTGGYEARGDNFRSIVQHVVLSHDRRNAPEVTS